MSEPEKLTDAEFLKRFVGVEESFLREMQQVMLRANQGPSERVKKEFAAAVKNSVSHAKRVMLDFLDMQRGQHPELSDIIGFLCKRVHNDVSLVEHQVMACFEIYNAGGTIPPMGRTAEERAAKPIERRSA